MNIVTSLLVCAAWGFLLYRFDIARLWLLNGVANQLLAVIGLGMGTTYLLCHATKRRYALCTAIPFVLVAATVFTAGVECLNMWWLAAGRSRPGRRRRVFLPVDVRADVRDPAAGRLDRRRAAVALVGAVGARRGETRKREDSRQRSWHELEAHIRPKRLRNAAGRDGRRAPPARILGPVSLTSLGIGCIIGAGIFVLTGVAAADDGGPAIILSFAVAAVGCALAALCYAEFAAMAPVAGSVYAYAYTTLGEIFAWIIGWDLILEYSMGTAAVASSWSGYLERIDRLDRQVL